MLISQLTLSALALAETVPVTILHTNDLHSHFRSEKNALGLGGVARLKTVVDELRSSIPNTLLVDGGDWSEGNIYYTDGTGGENLKMMDHIGYDAMVVGNHDWLNGPDVLLNAIANSHTRTALLAANVDPSQYSRAEEFRQHIQPYMIREIHGVKIAFIGVITYEFIYDRFFKPVRIEEPLFTTRNLAHWLKKEKGVDAVVAISHNGIFSNKLILEFAPDLDLVIGAHDHKKLSKPVIVKRLFAPDAWIVETGCWGRYLGRVDMKITPKEEAKKRRIRPVELVNYSLTQLDSSIPEDPETLTRIESLEREIEKAFGPIFSDHIADSDMEVSRDGLESPMGNLTTDSYRYATHADAAFDNINFIYGELHEGAINSADVFNANPGVYNPETHKTWTIKVLPINGLTLEWMLDLAVSPLVAGLHGAGSVVAASGISLELGHTRAQAMARPRKDEPKTPTIEYEAPIAQPDPVQALSELHPYEAFTLPLIKNPAQKGWETSGLTHRGFSWLPFRGSALNILINGEPINPLKFYRVAMSSGFLASLLTLNTIFKNRIPMTGLFDTGIEAWKSMKDYISAMGTITSSKLRIGSRFIIRGPDLGMLYDDIQWTPRARTSSGTLARVTVHIHNYGMHASPAGSMVAIYKNRHGTDESMDPDLIPMSDGRDLPSIAPGHDVTVSWNTVLIPDHLGLASVTAYILTKKTEANWKNNSVTRYFRVPKDLPLATSEAH